MNRSSVAALVVVILACSPPPPRNSCGGEVCASAEQRCDRNTLHCVTDRPPVISLSAPLGVVSEASFFISGTVTDDDHVVSSEWRAGTSDWAALELDAMGHFNVTVDSPSLDAQELVVSVRARDVLREVVANAGVKVDRVAPDIELLSPDAGAVIGASGFSVVVRATDGSGSLAELSIAGAPQPQLTSGAVASIVVDVAPTANYEPVKVPVVASDARGNRTSKTFTFIGDRVAPVVHITSPTPQQVVTSPTITVSFSATDPGPMTASCRVGATLVPAVNSGSGWSCVLPLEFAERAEPLDVIALDAAGNESVATVEVLLDRVAPDVILVAPSPNAIVNTALTVTALVTGAPISVSAHVVGLPAVALVQGPMTWSGVVPIPAHDFGAEEVEVIATDGAGNVTTVRQPIDVDTVAPTVGFTAPAPSQKFNVASFTSSTDVRVTWAINDLDPMASTTLVDGVTATGLQVLEPTSSTDNPRTYTTSVTVRDRAGNTGSASISYSVDRVAPDVLTWVPANGRRNVFPRTTSAIFSEAVSSPTGGLLRVVGAANQPANSGSGTAWSASLDGFALQGVDLAIAADAVDAYGNPFAPAPPPSRRVELGTGFAHGTNLVLAPNVTQFDANADSDGVLTVSAISSGQLRLLRDTGSVFSTVTTPITASALRAHVNSWVVVGADLSRSTRFAVVVQGSSTNFRYWNVNGSASDDFLPNSPAVVTRPALGIPPPTPFMSPWEGDNAPVGLITDSTYTRGLRTFNISGPGRFVTLQSNAGWAVLNAGATMQWSRFYCSYSSGAFCEGYLNSVTQGPNAVGEQGAVTRGGGCLALTWNSGATHQVVFQTAPACESNGAAFCFGSVPVPAVLPSTNDLKVATWDANGEDTLLFSQRVGNDVWLTKMNAGCSTTATALATLSALPGVSPGVAPLAHLPVRVGPDFGLLYVDSGNTLRLHVP